MRWSKASRSSLQCQSEKGVAMRPTMRAQSWRKWRIGWWWSGVSIGTRPMRQYSIGSLPWRGRGPSWTFSRKGTERRRRRPSPVPKRAPRRARRAARKTVMRLVVAGRAQVAPGVSANRSVCRYPWSPWGGGGGRATLRVGCVRRPVSGGVKFL